MELRLLQSEITVAASKARLRGIARDDVCQLLFLVRNPDINLFQNAAIVEPLACFLKPFNLRSDLCYIFGEHSDNIVTLRQVEEWNRDIHLQRCVSDSGGHGKVLTVS